MINSARARLTGCWASHDGTACCTLSAECRNMEPPHHPTMQDLETKPVVPAPATQPERAPKHKSDETPLEAIASICVVLVVGLFVLTFIFQNFEIPSSSMVKTLLVGDHVLVDRISLAPPAKWAPFVFYRDVRRGDIIVFFKPGEPDLFLVKRTIGIPGDHIHL